MTKHDTTIMALKAVRRPAIATALAAALFALVSCSGGKDAPKEEPATAREIMKTYTKTLATAPDKARDAGALMEQRNKDALKDFE